MKVIGITGGVGAGKSEILDILLEVTNCVVLRADEVAKELEKKGQPCYEPLIKLLGKEILGDNEEIDKIKMAQAIFSSDKDEVLMKVNSIVHPAVKKYILEFIDKSAKEKKYDFIFIEAALLIEEHYDKICDELWYIYADEIIRRNRLKSSRGYSDDKITGIINSQLDEATFRKYCKNVVDNSGSLDDTRNQLVSIINKERE